MNHSTDRRSRYLGTLRIIALALILGATFFLLLAVYLVSTQGGLAVQDRHGDELPMLTLIAVGVLVLEVPLAFVLPGILERKSLASVAASPREEHVVPVAGYGKKEKVSDEEFLLLGYQTSRIARMALFEGASLLGSMAYLVEARPLGLAVGAAALLLLCSSFPTEGRVSNWLEQKRREVEQLRARGTTRVGM